MHYLIVNQKHLKGKGIKHLNIVKQIFDNAKIPYEILLTERAGDAKDFTEKITQCQGANAIVAMGGDGTLHEIINGFKNFENCSLGLIPFGTGNDFAEAAGIPFDIKSAAEIIALNKPRYIDFIQLSSGLRSINAVGMGIDVDVTKRANEGKCKTRSKYLRALIVSLIKFKSYNFIAKYDGKEERHFGLIAALGNGRQFGGGIKMFPQAKVDDGFMDLCIVDYISKPKMIGAFIKLMRGKANEIKGATMVRTKAASFLPENKDFSIQAEGELYDNVPIDAKLVENQLKFYLP